MNKTQRIYFNTGTTQNDKYIQFNLEQDVDTIEFMTLNIYTKDVYQDFNSDYGVLVGRVVANGGVGIPNAKISVFIPLSDEDAENSDIANIYPYKTPRDKNAQGKRYNLLPRVSEFEPSSGTYKPKQPFGSFPIKPEIVANLEFLDVYKKYYKYTALTNSAGDYMIFGVPIGVQTVHLSVDITDIGKYSMTPAAMVTNLGYSPNLFTDNNSKIKPSDDLTDLPNIETQEITVNVIPFWGDTTNFTIGITRQDFRIRSVLTNTFIIFGTAYTDGDGSMYGSSWTSNDKITELFCITAPRPQQRSMTTKRIGKVSEKIYYYLPEITDAQIASGTLDPTDPKVVGVLDSSQYSVYKRDGDFVFIVSCNRNKIITDDFGNDLPVSNNSVNGIFTQFKGFMTLTISNDTIPMDFTGTLDSVDRTTVKPIRYTYKFPQQSPPGKMLHKPDNTAAEDLNQKWRREYYTFTGGSIYSVAYFHGLTYNDMNSDDDSQFPLTTNRFFDHTVVNKVLPQLDLNVGLIQTGSGDGVDLSAQYGFPSNAKGGSSGLIPVFGANWMNFAIHFPQVGWVSNGYAYLKYVRIADHFQQQIKNDEGYNGYFILDNTQPIAGGDFNTSFFARSDLHWTDFIYVPKSDITIMNAPNLAKGFTNINAPGLSGRYKSGATPCPYNGGKLNGQPTNTVDPNTYFYKGLDTANCIEYLISLGLV